MQIDAASVKASVHVRAVAHASKHAPITCTQVGMLPRANLSLWVSHPDFENDTHAQVVSGSELGYPHATINTECPGLAQVCHLRNLPEHARQNMVMRNHALLARRVVPLSMKPLSLMMVFLKYEKRIL